MRDIYDIDANTMLLIATDRLSAFDVILPTPIKDKGALLTEIANFWFEKLGHIVPNHLTGINPDSVVSDPFEKAQLGKRALVVKKLKPLPIEAIVRGYIVGSGWKEYKASGTICGIPLPVGLQEASKFIKKGDEKARISFIMGQLFSDNNQPNLALESYKAVLSNKPSYDLQLQASLAIHQLEGDIVALNQLLKDPKNEESKAVIYVKIGQYYYARKDFKKAKENWEKGGENNPNKGELYFQLGGLFAKQMKV